MEHQANYLTVDELNFRKALFEANQALVDQLNSNPNQTARFETNQFSDKTKAEKNAVLGLIGDLAPNPPQRSLAAIKSKQEVYYDNETDTYWSLFLEPVYYWKTFSWETYTWENTPGNISFWDRPQPVKPPKPDPKPDPIVAPVSQVDWRGTQYSTPVKDQGGCGSCWAFTATAVYESMIAITYGTAPERLSEQEYVNC